MTAPAPARPAAARVSRPPAITVREAAELLVGAGRVVWAPQPGSQTIFLTCPIYEALYEGTRGPGKTDALLMDFAKDVGKGHGAAWRGILFRESYPQLADVVAKSKRWFYQIFPDATFNESTYTWKWPGGEELLLRYIETPDDYWNYHGHEYPWIGWEELTNWADLACYEAMMACSRCSVPGVPRRVRATANPFGIGHHAVKAYFIDPAPAGVVITGPTGLPRVRIHGHWSENTALLTADPEYPARLAADSNVNRRRAWLGGDWDIVAGGFFDDVWDRAAHVLRPFPLPRSWRLDRSFDWGSSKPFSVGWWAESDGTPATLADGTPRFFPRGTLVRVAEWYGVERDEHGRARPNVGLRMLSGDIAVGIRAREAEWGLRGVQPGPADPSIFAVEDGKSIADGMKAKGVTWTEGVATPGSRKNGWEALRERLGYALPTQRGYREEPALYVFDCCTDFIRTVPVLPRDPRKPEDVNTKAEDHVADETRYRLLAAERKPWTSLPTSR